MSEERDERTATAQVKAALHLFGPQTLTNLANITGLSRKQVRDVVGVLRKRYGSEQIFISTWIYNLVMYSLGPGEDVVPVRKPRKKPIVRHEKGQPVVVIKPYEGLVGKPASPFDGLIKE